MQGILRMYHHTHGHPSEMVVAIPLTEGVAVNHPTRGGGAAQMLPPPQRGLQWQPPFLGRRGAGVKATTIPISE